jgi:hypothetical protein
MRRKEFIKRLGFGTLSVPFAAACGNTFDDKTEPDAACTTTPPETAGPFPTKDPESLQIVDIRSDRTGIETVVKITIQNKNNNCSPLRNAMVDVWHCDKDGYYSEYGGNGLQPLNLRSVHFLRGRQQTNQDGVVSFKTIFPGWYPGRAPHIHVEVFDSTGKSLLVTQIAIPTDVCDNVYTTGTEFYTRGKQDTSNTGDGVFSNSLAAQLASIEGSVATGYTVAHTIVVSA